MWIAKSDAENQAGCRLFRTEGVLYVVYGAFQENAPYCAPNAIWLGLGFVPKGESCLLITSGVEKVEGGMWEAYRKVGVLVNGGVGRAFDEAAKGGTVVVNAGDKWVEAYRHFAPLFKTVVVCQKYLAKIR